MEWDGVGAQCPYCAHLTDHMYRDEMIYLLVTSEMLKVSLSYLIGSSWAHLPDFYPNCFGYNKESETHQLHLMREILSLSYLVKHNLGEKNCPSMTCSKGWGKYLYYAYSLKRMI